MAVEVSLGTGGERADTIALARERRAMRVAGLDVPAIARLSSERFEGRGVASAIRVVAAAVLAARTHTTATASDKSLITFLIPTIGAVAALPLEGPVAPGGIVPARVASALGLVLLVVAVGGFLLGTVSGAMAQGPGGFTALAVLVLVHLFVVVPVVGLRSR